MDDSDVVGLVAIDRAPADWVLVKLPFLPFTSIAILLEAFIVLPFRIISVTTRCGKVKDGPLILSGI
jgi:hypothetical protein